MQVLQDCVVLFFFCLYSGVLSEQVTLNPNDGAVIENESITLTCSNDGTDQVSSSRWSYSAVSTNPVIVLIESSCVAAGFLNNSALYEWTCHRNNTFSLKIKKVERKNHGETWKCRQGNSESNTVAIYVIVPVSKVEMTMPTTSKITVSENSNKNFVCNTSPARPGSKVEWFIAKTSNASDFVQIFSNITRSNTTDDTGLVNSTGLLIYKPKRSVNTWFIYCIAHNVKDRQVQSNRIQLNVTYAPDGPPTIKGVKNNTHYFVIEDTMGQLICISTGGNPKAHLSWNCFNESSITYTNETTVTSEVTWTASRIYTGQCKCESNHIETEAVFAVAKIEVLYPPSYPVVMKDNNELPTSNPIYTIINNTLLLFCNSSSNPQPTFTWTSPDGRENRGSSLSLPRFDFINTGQYICTAVNKMHDSNGKTVSGLNTTHVDLEILHPPTTPSFRYQQQSGGNIGNGSIDVVTGDIFDISCNSSAIPEPTYSWRWKYKIIESQILALTSVSTDVLATCTVIIVMNETLGESRVGMTDGNVSVNVLYPPKEPTILLQIEKNHEQNVSDQINVIEKRPFTLKCKTISKPEPSYSWYGPLTSKSSELFITGLTREQADTYSCHSFNEMKRTFGPKEKGENRKIIQIHVLYAPEIGILQAKTAVERSSINITCPVINGNPSQGSVYWKRDDKGQIWDGKNLIINDVFRNDTAEYTCIVNNIMEPTSGDPVNGTNSRSFSLDVLYKACVLDFFVKGHFDRNPVILEENVSVELNCNLASHPKPNVTIYFMTNILKRQEDTLSLLYVQTSMSCEHSGVYKCTGINKYNSGMPSQKYLTINVRCFPRPSPYVKIQKKFFIDVQDRITMSFTAVAYPIPGEDDYKWRKYVGSVWKPLTNSENSIIEISGLKSNLTIFSVEQPDYGTYRLDVQNSIGIFEQKFTIGPKVKPEPPTNFEHLQSFVTENSFTLRWKPGLDGGYPQTFVLRYRKSSDRTWTDISVPSRDDESMNYTLTSLESSTEYEVEIYSLNMLGGSTKVDTLRIRTRGIRSDEVKTDISIIAGSVAAVFAMTVVVILVIVVIRRRRSKNLRRNNELVKYENSDPLGKNIQMEGSRTVLDGDYEEIGDGVRPLSKGEHYETLKKDKGALHSYQDIEISHNQQISLHKEQSQKITQTKIGKAGQIVRYVKENEAEHMTKETKTTDTADNTSDNKSLDDYVNLTLS